MEVLEAFTELAVAVSGPRGFWRKTVAHRWLGCHRRTDSPACKRMKTLTPELARFDKLVNAIQHLEPRAAARFLRKHYKKLGGYLATYVPVKPSASAMEKTPFFKKHLEPVMKPVL